MKHHNTNKLTAEINSQLYQLTGNMTNVNGWQLNCSINGTCQKSRVVFYKDSIVIFGTVGNY